MLGRESERSNLYEWLNRPTLSCSQDHSGHDSPPVNSPDGHTFLYMIDRDSTRWRGNHGARRYALAHHIVGIVGYLFGIVTNGAPRVADHAIQIVTRFYARCMRACQQDGE